MKKPVIDKTKSYTFFDYFKMNADNEAMLGSFGYSFAMGNPVLPRTARMLDQVDDLRLRIEESRPYVSITSEAARREFLIAPVLMQLVHYTKAKVKVEYPIVVSDQLQGSLDYYLESNRSLLIVQAKNEDLERGFKQLAVELIAMDEWTDSPADKLYGAVSIGRIWQFGILERGRKHITQDLGLYVVPDDLADLLSVLVAILNGE